jgi:hypothetical protein
MHAGVSIAKTAAIVSARVVKPLCPIANPTSQPNVGGGGPPLLRALVLAA